MRNGSVLPRANPGFVSRSYSSGIASLTPSSPTSVSSTRPDVPAPREDAVVTHTR